MWLPFLRQRRLCEPTAFLIGLLVFAGAMGALLLSIPLFAIWTYHRRKLVEIKARQNVEIAEETRAALAVLRQEMAALRDTTTQYDVGFDTALQRIESRVANVEQRVGQVERETQSAQYNRT